MKHFIITTLMFVALVSCKNDESTTVSTSEKEKIEQEEVSSDQIELVEENNQEVAISNSYVSNDEKYNEYHPNGQLKITGMQNKETGARNGIWTAYYENGIKWSESYYVNGKRDGHSVTFFPNGKVRYIGEYRDDEKIGLWTFKDEEGNIVEEIQY